MIPRAIVLPSPPPGCESAEMRSGVRFGVTAGHLLILVLLAVSAWWHSLYQFKPPPLTVQLVTSTQMAQVQKQAQKDLVPELPPEPLPPEPEPPEPTPPPPEPPTPVVPEVTAVPTPPAPAPAPKPPVPKPVEVKTPAPKPPTPKPVPVSTPKPAVPKPVPAAVKAPVIPKETTADRVRRIREAFVKPKKPVLARLPAPTVAPLHTPSAADIAERINASVRNLQVAVAANVNVQEDSPQRTRDWFAALTQQLYAVWRQPSRVTVGGGQPRVTVKLVVRANGQVVSAQVARRSGVATMDASVERTLAALTKVVAPSAYGIRNSSMPVEVQFELD